MTPANKEALSVDVLAVMQEASELLYRENYACIPNDLTEARAAVAELIEADKEFDAAYVNYDEWKAVASMRSAAVERLSQARDRRAAALQRVSP